MKSFIIFSILLILFPVNSYQTPGQTAKPIPVIVELFTSEGCETCPPADKYLQKLVEEQPVSGAEIIALSEHVDYWNRSAWTDKFSSAQFSSRQKYYVVFFKRTEIYTPQFVVDGTMEMTIKNGNKLLAESIKKPKGEVELKLKSAQGNTLSLDVKTAKLPEISNGDKALVLIAVTENNLTSNVSGGENSGRTLRHAAVTRYLKSIGEIQGSETNLSAEIELGKDWKRENLSIVAFVQEANSRRILGAAKIDLKDL